MEIGKYALYKTLSGLNEEGIDSLIGRKIDDFDPVESVCYSSFLNMIFQTTGSVDLYALQKHELEQVGLELSINELFFYRENILYFTTVPRLIE